MLGWIPGSIDLKQRALEHLAARSNAYAGLTARGKFPDESVVRQWFRSLIWPDGRYICPKYGRDYHHEASHARMPYRCLGCRECFSVKTGAVMAGSPVPLSKWAYAMVYLIARR